MVQSDPAKRECGKCGGAGFLVIEWQEQGVARSAAKECKCKRVARFRAFHRMIPPEFQKANLARLRPRLDRHPEQVELVSYVKEHPESSYIFCGKNRVGKSHIGWCLARRALLNGKNVVACNLSELLDEYRQMEKPDRDSEGYAKFFKPKVVAGDLQVVNTRYCLFLQEFDKPRATAYAVEKLFELIDAAFNYQHQIVITSNLSIVDLSAHWSEHGSRYGNGVMSRISERCVEANLF